MSRIHYHDDVPYTIDVGPHRGWTTYQFEWNERRFKLMTFDEDRDVKATIYCDDEGNSPWARYRNESFDCVISISTAIAIVQANFRAYEQGIEAGKRIALAEVRKSLGL